jgi:Rod binding domain-containing protein
MGAFSGIGPLSAQMSASQSQEDQAIRALNAPRSANDGAKIDKGAQEFESVLLGSWLQQAEQSFATVPGTDDDQDPGSSQMMSLGVQSLSTSLAATGGIGIAKMVAKAMHAVADKANAAEPETPATGNTDAPKTN